jgi:hypothetical protein
MTILKRALSQQQQKSTASIARVPNLLSVQQTMKLNTGTAFNQRFKFMLAEFIKV